MSPHLDEYVIAYWMLRMHMTSMRGVVFKGCCDIPDPTGLDGIYLLKGFDLSPVFTARCRVCGTCVTTWHTRLITGIAGAENVVGGRREVKS